MKEAYFDLVMLLERLHRLFLEIAKVELDRLGVRDLTNVQMVILYNIGKNQLTVGEISNRGYYLGSNVSYNLKKMIENEYILQEQSSHDKRSTQVRLASKGLKLLEKFDQALQKQVQNLGVNGLQEEDVKSFLSQGRRLENFWSHMLLHHLRL
jgi:DNA-binding MarR family transcriptional regulator